MPIPAFTDSPISVVAFLSENKAKCKCIDPFFKHCYVEFVYLTFKPFIKGTHGDATRMDY